MGCTDLIELGSWSVKEWVPGHTMIVKGLRFLLESFLEGCVDLKYLAFT